MSRSSASSAVGIDAAPVEGELARPPVEDWLVTRIARALGVPPAEVDRERSPLELGLDSLEAVEIAEELAQWLGRSLPPTLFWEHPSIGLLAAELSRGAERQRTSSPPPRTESGFVTARSASEKFATFVNPHLGRVLSSLRLDKEFVRGDGCFLFDATGRRYLDFLAMYGALPFGHNPPEIWSAIRHVADTCEPSFVQPSLLPAASELARRLIAVAPEGLRHVTFANSGAEAIEIAIKMSRSATGRRGILSATRSFHGKTLGALSATGSAKYQRGFGAPVVGFDKIPYGDLVALQATLGREPDRFAAFIVEPIQGEGGVVEPPRGYLHAAQTLCREAGVLFVVDEVQTGLGRTGTLFASEVDGLQPDLLVLAKALGGGLMPIGACLSTSEAFSPELGLRHSSTFAGNALAARAGIATLDRLERGDRELVADVARKGAALRDGLLHLRARYPSLVADVRGRGFLLGIQLTVDPDLWPRSILGTAAKQGVLAAIFASYLLNAEGVRVAPTLNGSDVLRIEPPLTATQRQCDDVLAALDRALAVFETGDAGRVFRAILDGAPASLPKERVVSSPRRRVEPQARDARFAFILHPTEIEAYADYDPTLRALDRTELLDVLGNDPDESVPTVLGTTRVSSDSGATAFGELILLPRTAAELMAMPRDRALAEIRRAVTLGRDRGAQIVGLGAFTSILSQGGLALLDVDVALTTGNSFTALSIHDAIDVALSRWRKTPSSEAVTVAVLGAAGSIGRAASVLLGERAARLILVGNPGRDAAQNRMRLREVAGEICRYLATQREAGAPAVKGSIAARLAEHAPVSSRAPLEEHCAAADALARRDGGILLATSADAVLPLADVIVVATNATRPLVDARMLKREAIVCDVSRPRNVSAETARQRPDVLVVDGGVIEVPGRVHVGDFGLEPGLVFACMAETMILALERRFEHCSLGMRLPIEPIVHLRRLGAKHGFRLATLRSFERTLDLPDAALPEALPEVPSAPQTQRSSTTMPSVVMSSAPSVLGDAIGAALERRGHEVRAFDAATLERLGDEEEAVLVRVDEQVRPDDDLEALRRAIVEPLRELVSLVERRSKLRLVYMSTAFVSGTRRGLFTEFDVDCQQGFRSAYEQVKLDAEKVLRASPAFSRTTILRPSSIVQVSEDSAVVSAADHLLRLLRSGRPLVVAGDPVAELDLVTLDYVTKATAAVVSLPSAAGKTLHLVSGPTGRRTLADLARIAAPGADARRISYRPLIGAPLVPWSTRFMRRHASFPDRETRNATVLMHAVTFDDYVARTLLTPLGITCPLPESYLDRASDLCGGPHASSRTTRSKESTAS